MLFTVFTLYGQPLERLDSGTHMPHARLLRVMRDGPMPMAMRNGREHAHVMAHVYDIMLICTFTVHVLHMCTHVDNRHFTHHSNASRFTATAVAKQKQLRL